VKDLILILPEILIALTLGFVVIGEITYHGERYRLISITALMGLASALIQSFLAYKYGPSQVFNNTLSIDGLSFFFRLFFISLAVLSIIVAIQTREISPNKRAEYTVLILAATLGMCLAASSTDLLLAFLSLQFVNIIGYFLAGYAKRSPLSNEAAFKYMLFGVVSAGLLAYGMALLFSATHVLNIYEIHRSLLATPLSREVSLVVFTLIFLSLSFQLGAFPMYLWAPDVLEGSPTPVSAFLSIGSRAAGFVIALRFLLVLFAQPSLTQGQWEVLGQLDWTRLVALAAGLSMVIGSFLAMRQVGAKRMVAALIVAETGHLLMGVLVLDSVGIAALLYNLMIELFSITGIFFVLSFLMDELRSDRLEDLKGMLARAVPECVCLILFLITLVGLPPMPGFIGKFTLIGAALRQHWMALAVVAIVSMAVSTVSVARLSYCLIGDFRKSASQHPADRTANCTMGTNHARHAFLAVLMIPVLLTGIFAEQALAWTAKSIQYILW